MARRLVWALLLFGLCAPALVYAVSAPIAGLGGYWLIERTSLA
jgi:hypothetical protein